MSSFYRLPASRTVRPMRRRAGRRLLVPAVVSLILVVFGLSGLLLLRTHPRFAVNRVVLEGVPEARRSEAEELTDGWIGRPLTREERLRKFHSCARRVLPRKAAERIVELVEDLERLPDIVEIMDLARADQ